MLVQATADLAVDAKNCSVGKGSAIPGYHSCNAPRIPKGRPGDAGGSDDTMNPTEEKSGLMVPCTLNPGGALGAPHPHTDRCPDESQRTVCAEMHETESMEAIVSTRAQGILTSWPGETATPT
jgi:hypothetical protein